MCSNLKLSKTKNIVAGDIAIYRAYTHELTTTPKSGVFGFNKGIVTNVRFETHDSKWREYAFNRGYIEIMGFHEKGYDFYAKDQRSLFVPLLYNDRDEFSILTEDSEGPVAFIHHRMPIILRDNMIACDKWLKEGKILHLDPYLLISNKTA